MPEVLPREVTFGDLVVGDVFETSTGIVLLVVEAGDSIYRADGSGGGSVKRLVRLAEQAFMHGWVVGEPVQADPDMSVHLVRQNQDLSGVRVADEREVVTTPIGYEAPIWDEAPIRYEAEPGRWVPNPITPSVTFPIRVQRSDAVPRFDNPPTPAEREEIQRLFRDLYSREWRPMGRVQS